MDVSSPRFKAFTVTLGVSLWFFVISSAVKLFSIEIFTIFVVAVFLLTQIFALKLAKALDSFSLFNTKLFLGILFVTVISTYGILFRLLRIDLLRLRKQQQSYWLTTELLKEHLLKQY